MAYHFPPAGGPAVQRSAKFVKYLPEFGYRPLVLTAAEEDIDSSRDPSLLEELKGAEIVRCPGYQRWLIRLPRRLGLGPAIGFWARPDKNIWAWVPCAVRAARQLAREHRIDAIYTTAGPFSNIVLGYRLKRLLGVPWIVDYRDPWTDDKMGLWPTRLHYWAECRQERRAMAAADAAVVVTPTMQDLLARRYPACADKIHWIPNGFDRADFPGSPAPPSAGPLRIAYTGSANDYDFRPEVVRTRAGLRLLLATFAYRRGQLDLSTYSPLYLFRAASRLLESRPELRGKIQLLFAGYFGPRNRQLIQDLGLKDVVCELGYLPHAQSVRLLLDSDVLFLSLPSPADGSRSYHYTGKVFEYLASGRPILAAVPEGDAADLIRKARAGWCMNPYDLDRMASLLEKLIADKEAGNLSVDPDKPMVQQFERRTLTGQLAALLDRLCEASSP